MLWVVWSMAEGLVCLQSVCQHCSSSGRGGMLLGPVQVHWQWEAQGWLQPTTLLGAGLLLHAAVPRKPVSTLLACNRPAHPAFASA